MLLGLDIVLLRALDSEKALGRGGDSRGGFGFGFSANVVPLTLL
jgi:hypothetical protein